LVLGFGNWEDPPPCWEKFPNNPVFFLKAFPSGFNRNEFNFDHLAGFANISMSTIELVFLLWSADIKALFFSASILSACNAFSRCDLGIVRSTEAIVARESRLAGGARRPNLVQLI